MSYQVLARKWRPQTFADVVGQEHVLAALANGLNMGRLHHAYLFSGTRGVGKTSIARLLAKGLNCESGITATPCGKCQNCLEIEQGRFVDLIEIDAASRTKVEDTRELLDNVQYAPARGRFKVYLIDEVHMLSRHSFNALLKTLEEPPPHVKFLLATTDPQKLPVTILSRCLQFHLKALDNNQICEQLERILAAEQIPFEARALQLLARSAEGSLRDALSLTDQAIASGNGQITSQMVSVMLGMLDNDQAVSLLEALVKGDGPQVLAQIDAAATRGVDWEALLVEMLGLIHRTAMGQLSSAIFASEEQPVDSRLRELARTVDPCDLQLYYQTLLIGRKELGWAPERRMGVEMTLLRALAFHPGTPLAVPESIGVPVQSASAPVTTGMPATSPAASAQVRKADVLSTASAAPAHAPVNELPVPPPTAPAHAPVNSHASGALPDATSQLLQARSQLQRTQEVNKEKKGEPAAPGRARPVNNAALERLAAVTERVQNRPVVEPAVEARKKEAYRWKAQTVVEVVAEPVATPNALRSALEHEKTPELAAKLVVESQARDAWAAEVDKLGVPKLVQQLALNAWREQDGLAICLHLRSAQRHLNSPSARQTLAAALSTFHGGEVVLTVVEDDNLAQRTPLEWRQAIYEEKLVLARASINADANIQTLQQFFDADLEDDSIRPL